jgi:hypothetical protein
MDMRKLRLLLILISLVALAAAPAPVSAERGSWNNWHVHDGGSGTDADGLRHAGLVFFPQIWSNYASDPSLWAYCADATDKALVGGDGGAKVAAGFCQNELYIIHLQGIANDAPAPPLSSGWTPLTPGADFTFYYKLTPR